MGKEATGARAYDKDRQPRGVRWGPTSRLDDSDEEGASRTSESRMANTEKQARKPPQGGGGCKPEEKGGPAPPKGGGGILAYR